MDQRKIDDVSLRLWGRCVLSGAALREPVYPAPLDAMVLAIAALEPGLARARVAEWLWPDAPAASGNLRSRLHRLYQRVGVSLFASDQRLSLAPNVRLHVPSAQQVVAAISEMGMDGCQLLAGQHADHGEVAVWLENARQRWTARLLAVLADAFALTAEADDWRVVLLDACVALDPVSERHYRELMACHAARGDKSSALLVYERCRAALASRLGVLPDVATQSLHARILRVRHASDAASARSDVRDWPILEREGCVGLVAGALRAGKHVLLEGEAGVGKTTVLDRLCLELPVCYVRAQPTDKAHAFATIAGVFRRIGNESTAALHPQDRAAIGRLCPELTAEMAPAAQSFSPVRLRAALQAWGRSLAEMGYLAIAVDDLHYADDASLEALEWLLDADRAQVGEGDAPRFVLACRTHAEIGRLRGALNQHLAVGRLFAHELPRLSRAATEQLVRQARPAWCSDGQQLQAVHDISAGNPLFVRKLVEYGSLCIGDDAAGLKDALNELVRLQLKSCTAEGRLVASVVAIADGGPDIDFIGDILEKPRTAIAMAWSDLEQAGILAAEGFGHDLVRDAAAAAIPPSLRRWLHRRIAECAEARGMSAELCMRHWLAAGHADRALPHAVLHCRWLVGVGQREPALRTLMTVLTAANFQPPPEAWWMLSEFFPIERVSRVITASAMRGLHELSDAIESREARFDSPLSQAFALYVRALVASEVVGDVDTAMALCRQALELAPGCQYARAELMYTLAYYSSYLGCEDPANYVRGLEQLAGTMDAGPRRLRVQHLLGLSRRLRHSLTDTLRYWRSRRVEARRANDRFECASAEYELGKLFFAVGSWKSSLEMMDSVARSMEARAAFSQAEWCPAAFFVPAALQLGHFDTARKRMACFVESARTRSLLWRAWMALQLGDRDACLRLMDDMQLERRTPHLILMHVAQAVLHLEIAAITGERPSVRVGETLAMLDDLRDRRTGQCPARWEHMYAVIRFEYEGRPPMAADEMEALLARIRRRNSSGYVAHLQIMLAEQELAAGDVEQAVARAVESATILLKGRGPLMVYRPALAGRCADILDHAGHPLGRALWQAAARWVRDSESRLPPQERAAFLSAHPVHRRILASRSTCRPRST